MRAKELSARAFTSGGVVHLPDEAGELSDPGVQALLAHELTHVAQQRRFGADLPSAGSEEGQRLEAAAVGAEEWFRSGAQTPLVHRPIERSEPAVTVEQVQRAPADTGLTWSLPESDFAPDEAEVPDQQESEPLQPIIERQVDEQFVADPELSERLDRLEATVEEIQDLRAESDEELLVRLEDPSVLTRLAERLYANVRHRLRAELLIDRERRGALADLR